LIVDQEGKLSVRAPHHLPDEEIWQFIAAKRDWIDRQLRVIASRPRAMPLSAEQARELRDKILPKILERCRHFSRLTGLSPAKIRISGARTRWGSCSAGGTVSFNFRLALCPDQVIDYVIVHELLHLAEPNHSSRFWEKVAAIVPDHRSHRHWLRENGRLLYS
jgi:hypothetical protein